MHISAYDTFACHTLNMQKVVAGVEQANISGLLIDSNTQQQRMESGSKRLPRDVAIYLEQSDIPQFSHPLVIAPSSHNDYKGVVVVDGRNMARPMNYLKEGKFVPNNYDMYEFQILRANINAMLIRNETTSLSNLVTPITKVTSLWIQRAITRQYVVSQEIANIVQACGAIYCYAMFSGTTAATDEAKQLWSVRLQRDFPFLSKTVISIAVDNAGAMTDVVQLVETIKRATNTPILNSLTTGSFLQAIGSGWDAFHSREMMSVAIDHLPTLIAVVAKSQTQSFSKTGIARHVKEVLGSTLRDFLKSVDRLLLDDSTTHHR